ncbi:Protein transport protein SEC31 [Termitomyces sp. J132]|nr:Protein transport protein SEC31 [Termitomyces sp. J132]
MKLKEIHRTSTFAWSPTASLPLLATGTVAGALDESFSNESQLEIWSPNFLDRDEYDLGGVGQNGPKGAVKDSARFNRLAWGGDRQSHGVIAAGLENGELALWDPSKILAGAGTSESLILRNTTHTGPVRGLDFNPIQTSLLASGGVSGEVYIWDLKDPSKPYTPTPGSRSTKLDDITSVAWNQQVQYVLAGASSTGYTVVWDLRGKREVVALAYGGGAGTLAGQGATGSGLAIGGRRGMSDIAWHPDNATRLVTASEDDSSPVIMVWDLRNARAPEKILTGHEKGVLSLSWCKQDADLLLSCGKDNRALCWNPQTSEIIGELPSADNWAFQVDWCPRNPDLLATAFFDGTVGIHSIQSTNNEGVEAKDVPAPKGADIFDIGGIARSAGSGTLSLKQPPKWLRRPASSSFGFGGKLVSVSNLPSAQGKNQSSVVHIRKIVTEQDLVERAKKLQTAIEGGSDSLKTFAEGSAIAEGQLVPHMNYGVDSSVAATIGSGPSSVASEVLKNNSFRIYPNDESDVDRLVTKALVLGDFESAVSLCLSSDRFADAILLAVRGGPELLQRTQRAYFERRTTSLPYLRVFQSIVTDDLSDIVQNADLQEWQEIFVVLCTFAKQDEFQRLAEELGRRLEFQFTVAAASENVEAKEDAREYRQNATLTYLAAARLERLVNIWIDELMEDEKNLVEDETRLSGSRFSAHTQALQTFIEKVTVFRSATAYKDADLVKPLSPNEEAREFKLASLYDRYLEYADLLTTQGLLKEAVEFLQLTPEDYEGSNGVDFTQTQSSYAPYNTYGGTAPNSFTSASQPVNQGPYAPSASTYNTPNIPYQQSLTQPPHLRQQIQPQPQPNPQMVPPPPRGTTSTPGNTIVPPPPLKRNENGGWNDPPAVISAPRAPSSLGLNKSAAITTPFPNQAPGTPGFSPLGSPYNSPGQPASRTAPAPPPLQRMMSPPQVSLNPQHSSIPGPGPNVIPPVRGPIPGQTPSPGQYVRPQGVVSHHPQASFAPPLPPGPAPPGPYGPGPSPQPSHQQPLQPGPYEPPPGAQRVGPPQPPPQAVGGLPGVAGVSPRSSSRNAPRPQAGPPPPKYPPGDRSHIPNYAMPAYNVISEQLNVVKQRTPPQQKRLVDDLERRINPLFDALNCETLSRSVVDQLLVLTRAMEAHDRPAALAIHVDLLTKGSVTDDIGLWMSGVKQLIMRL